MFHALKQLPKWYGVICLCMLLVVPPPTTPCACLAVRAWVHNTCEWEPVEWNKSHVSVDCWLCRGGGCSPWLPDTTSTVFLSHCLSHVRGHAGVADHLSWVLLAHTLTSTFWTHTHTQTWCFYQDSNLTAQGDTHIPKAWSTPFHPAIHSLVLPVTRGVQGHVLDLDIGHLWCIKLR